MRPSQAVQRNRVEAIDLLVAVGRRALFAWTSCDYLLLARRA